MCDSVRLLFFFFFFLEGRIGRIKRKKTYFFFASPGATLAGPGREASRRAWAVAVRSAPLARVGARRGRMA